MLRFGKATTQSLRALARLQNLKNLKNLKNGSELATLVIWYATAREQKAVRRFQRQMLSNLEQKARSEATESVRYVAHHMLLSGKATSVESQRLLIEQETAEILEEKLLSKKEHK